MGSALTGETQEKSDHRRHRRKGKDWRPSRKDPRALILSCVCVSGGRGSGSAVFSDTAISLECPSLASQTVLRPLKNTVGFHSPSLTTAAPHFHVFWGFVDKNSSFPSEGWP